MSAVYNIKNKYPVPLKEYLQNTGHLLAHRVSQVFQELGFVTELTQGQGNGVDILVNDREGNLILVAEILNWSYYSELSPSRKNWIIANLVEYDCLKLLIYTTMKNESFLTDMTGYNVTLLKLGFQILPRHFFNFFLLKNWVVLRKIDSLRTKEEIRSKIVDFLVSEGIELLS